MAQMWTEKRVVISPDAPTLAAAVADRLLSRLARRTSAGKTTHIALAGGQIGTAVLRAAGASAQRAEVDWSRVHLWWGDEVFASRSDAERHERAAREALIERVAIPAENVHAIPGSDDVDDPDAAALAYASELADYGNEEQPWPEFYVCFLGVGSDGHVASLFPDRAEIQVTDRAVVAVREAPKPPAVRVTLTRPVINSARCVWLVVSGTDKAAALGLALAGASYETVPAAGAKGRKKTMLFVDEAAAANVPGELIDQDF
ncbi:6-phosphogluconolactonase [Microbacterium sp. VKM Ac-2870]|uniref:6-phosphogluconolactonase n=1 Tax=Microbacterium sp. VKM Ac-2870 TaxID=2783825 RepID=UPI00188B87ED|nr:6-phosphogluconolactonase [Microbacterium sp. VKM Ac-2870]MBF4561050.1 6-phosphogluconolactonase [Microbacterium sp. VKM Ac-2870]